VGHAKKHADSFQNHAIVRLSFIEFHGFMCHITKTIQTLFPHGQTNMANKSKETETMLREIFKTMNAHQAQEIREAYYNAVEGLRTLADALEIADADQNESAGPLLTEHFFACEALDVMKKSQLGRIL
jgi:hypothetical protein